MASNKKRRRHRFSLFPLFPLSQKARLKYSLSSRRQKNKARLKDPVTDEEPSCSHIQEERKGWRMRVGKVRKLFTSPLKRLGKSVSGFMVSSSKRAQKLSARYNCGYCRGVLKTTRSGSSESHSDDSNPAEFSYEYVKDLLENNDFYLNSSTPQQNGGGIK